VAQFLTTVEDAQHGLGKSQILFDGDEFGQDQRRPGEDRGAPTHLDQEAASFLTALRALRGMKPRSWMPVMLSSSSQQEKEDLNLRGSRWVIGWRRKWRA
jgi:hypothetical protein